MRTLEAIIAIVLILIFIYSIMPKEELDLPENPMENYGNFVIKKLIYNNTIREKLIDINDSNNCDKNCLETAFCNIECKEASKDIDDVVSTTLLPDHNYFFKICNQPSCITAETPMDKSIYMFDALIGSDTTKINPLIVRIWIWNN